jgi:hypothetical protein
MAPRFKVGDFIEVYHYDLNEEYLYEGIIMITEYEPISPYSSKGTYSMKCIRGSVTWVSYSAYFFDEINTHILLGNINDDATLKVLYGNK